MASKFPRGLLLRGPAAVVLIVVICGIFFISVLMGTATSKDANIVVTMLVVSAILTGSGFLLRAIFGKSQDPAKSEWVGHNQTYQPPQAQIYAPPPQVQEHPPQVPEKMFVWSKDPQQEYGHDSYPPAPVTHAATAQELKEAPKESLAFGLGSLARVLLKSWAVLSTVIILITSIGWYLTDFKREQLLKDRDQMQRELGLLNSDKTELQATKEKLAEAQGRLREISKAPTREVPVYTPTREIIQNEVEFGYAELQRWVPALKDANSQVYKAWAEVVANPANESILSATPASIRAFVAYRLSNYGKGQK